MNDNQHQAHSFVVPGPPRGQGRPRFARIGKFVRTYDPKESVDWKSKVALFATQANVQPIEGPVALTVHAIHPRPQRLMRRRDPDGEVLAPCKPDWDNIGKAVADALTGIAYRDDSQIVSAAVHKLYHAKDGQPHTRVTVQQYGDTAT